MADQRRIDMKMSGKPEEEAWIKMINGQRPTAGGKIIKTKKDLLEVKKYLGMVTRKVRDAYNKRLAELSGRKSADSVDAIAEKYGHELVQKDAAGAVDKDAMMTDINRSIQYASTILNIVKRYKDTVVAKNAYNPGLAKAASKNLKLIESIVPKLAQFG